MGDSLDASCATCPILEILPPSPTADDACDFTSGPKRPRAPTPVRLPAIKTRRVMSAGGISLVGDGGGESRFCLIRRGRVVGYNVHLGGGHVATRGAGGVVEGGGMEGEEERERRILLADMADAGLKLGYPPPTLYLAVSLVDTWRARGRRLDAVQRAVLGLTCLHVAGCRLPSSPGIRRSPEEICHVAGVREGTVKGCMIARQVEAVEGLMGGGGGARSLWSKMGASVEGSEAEYMGRFVTLVGPTEYGQMYFSDNLRKAAVRCCGSSLSSSDADLELAQMLSEFLCPDSSPCADRVTRVTETCQLAIGSCFPMRKALACS